jgi:hypothetical protein
VDDSLSADTPDDAADKLFKQADVDRIVKDRLARQKAQFSDYEELKAKADKLAEIEAASKTELEKALERAGELEKKAAAEAARAQEALLRSAVVSEAAKKNVVDPDAALALLDRGSLEFDDAGLPTNVGSAIDALLEAKPYLAGKRQPTSADLGARGDDPTGRLTRDDLKKMSSAEIVKAQDEGRLDHLLGGS